MKPLPPHGDDAQAAILAELVRLTLPHHPSTDRRELTRTRWVLDPRHELAGRKEKRRR